MQDIGEHANDLEALSTAITKAQQEQERPSLIIVRSHIGYGSPKFQDTPEAHGAPLGADEVRQTKQAYGWPADEKFLVPERALTHAPGYYPGRYAGSSLAGTF